PNRTDHSSSLDDNPIDGIMQSPQISQLTIQGPVQGVPPRETSSRRKILTCIPSSGPGELSCARKILTALARKAYRRPLTDNDVSALISFYKTGREHGRFEGGLERGLP